MIYYRYEVQRFAPPVDEFDNVCGEGTCELALRAYLVAKETPKGVRLANGKFILTSAWKQWACPTIPEAWESFQRRKAKQISILSTRLRRAETEALMTQADARDLTQWVL